MAREKEDPIDRELAEKGRAALGDFDARSEIVVEGRKKESKLISIRIPTDMLTKLRVVAEAQGNVGYQAIIKSYIAEGLREDISHLAQGTVAAEIQTSAQALTSAFWEPRILSTLSVKEEAAGGQYVIEGEREHGS